MNVVYVDSESEENDIKPSIFLAGPTPRSLVNSDERYRVLIHTLEVLWNSKFITSEISEKVEFKIKEELKLNEFIITKSWRPTIINLLEQKGFQGTIYVPEPSDEQWGDYLHQVNWEKEKLDNCDIIIFWIPRELQFMPAFTTNVEFGLYLNSGKVLYGRPPESPKNRYLDFKYQEVYKKEPCNTMEELVESIIRRIKNEN